MTERVIVVGVSTVRLQLPDDEELSVQEIVIALKRCRLPGCGRLLPVGRREFCTDRERWEFYNKHKGV